jgi:hypothetical protein
MFPISKDKLSIEEITDYWSRETQPPASPNELLAFLQGAWWRGEIKGETPLTRLALLKSMFNNDHLSGIAFVTREDAILPQGIELPDGSLKLDDLRPRVFVPSGDTDTWSEASCASAFGVLAKLKSFEHCTDRTIQFLMMELTLDEFVRLLREHNKDVPNFWRLPPDKPALPRQASDAMIRTVTQDVYDSANARCEKPPNIKQLVGPVLGELKAKGYTATGNRIQKIGGRLEFRKRRRKPGKTVSSEKHNPQR